MMLGDATGFAPVLDIAMGILCLSLVMTFVRLVIGPSLPDRVVALDQFATMVVGVIAVFAISSQRTELLRAAMVLALVSFLGTIAFARYAEKRGRP